MSFDVLFTINLFFQNLSGRQKGKKKNKPTKTTPDRDAAVTQPRVLDPSRPRTIPAAPGATRRVPRPWPASGPAGLAGGSLPPSLTPQRPLPCPRPTPPPPASPAAPPAAADALLLLASRFRLRSQTPVGCPLLGDALPSGPFLVGTCVTHCTARPVSLSGPCAERLCAGASQTQTVILKANKYLEQGNTC